MTHDAQVRIRHFRQILMWPLQLMPIRPGEQIQKHWEYLDSDQDRHPWRAVVDEFGDPESFQERHYSEFVTFLPHVQRFLYGECSGGRAEDSPIRVYRRSDIAAVRIVLGSTYPDPLVLKVVHVDLYFFLDIDVVILALEILADDLPLDAVHEILYRFGRAYPPFWDDDGGGGHCPRTVEWLAVDGRVLATSDYENQGRFLRSVARHRAPEIAAHWEFLLAPMVHSHLDRRGPIRFRQLEYYRMPLMAYAAVEDPQSLTRAQFVRLALATAPGPADSLPFSAAHLADFERRYCYDRGWHGTVSGTGNDLRLMSCGHATVVVGCSHDRFFTGLERGVLAQFRHQLFLVCLIAHVHKAALLMLSDRLVGALNRLDIHSTDSVKEFKRQIRHAKEIFLRFTHRYWFHEVSDQMQARDLYHLCSGHLGTDALYAEVREEIQDMSDYLDSDSLRRQANTVVRLTVVTVFGLIGTIVTGFLGMNLFAAAEADASTKALYFMLTLIPVLVLTFYTIARSKRLSDFLEAISDERLSTRAKLSSLIAVWKNPSTTK
jgi:CorA-like Mg2+ transporter protein